MGISKKVNTPFGLSRWVFFVAHVIVIAVTGYAICATEPLKELFAMAGICSHLPEAEMKLKWIEMTNAGVVASIAGSVIIGALADFSGPKVTALLGQALFGGGYAFIFFSPIDAFWTQYIGCCFLGLAFIAIFVSHTSVAGLFPASSTFILAVLGASADFSLFIPNFIGLMAEKIGLKWAIAGYLIVIGAIFVLEIFLVPSRPFSADSSDQNRSSSESSDAGKAAANQMETAPFGHLSLRQQLGTPVFWIITAFTCLNMFRKAHFMQLVAPIFEEIAVASGATPEAALSYLSVFRNTLWAAVFPALLMGFFTNAFGIAAGFAAENLWGVLLFLCCSLPVMKLQWFSIAFFNCMSAYLFGIMFASLSKFFGWKTFGTLQGICMVFAGASTHLFIDWNKHVVMRLHSIRQSNMILFVLSLAMFAGPIGVYMLTPTKRMEVEEETVGLLEEGEAVK
eukprot:CAMPEP_0113844488 /NCGR_PEP_ID=MMETSP0372-20130328/263_1 /TAXON_ID=340204 /ORGANISM="Lankesteria abbotti" /LENGTH=452 /DNA_ID=CAMNT_0000813493 /DNA_START=37 /DNA_END=1395 /DNA_ORIENTATION=+ /assembly_acc=CAM_ASM_000359